MADGENEVMSQKMRIVWLYVLPILAVWGATLVLLRNSPFLDADRYAEALYANRLMESAGAGQTVSLRKDSALAYWACYPDVAQDAYFGREGPLNLLGAREHFDRHGRAEGRIWPLTEDDCRAAQDAN
ncbi:MAG: hypothetical protein JJ878_12755 [Alphaproteobacteria bacterium]|nr:hypothetical protein [Alphaproteobacteria bacterium]MBO6863502.1 hypothetical protein [Alphaproteobacteria bacterium]